MRIYQNTPENCRRTLGRITLAYSRGEMDETTAKTIGHLLNLQLGYWKLIKETDIDARLEALENKAAEK